MPVHNTGIFLINAIDSILNQTYKDWELVIVDDASTDNSKNILKRYAHNKKIKIYYNQTNVGPYAIRNFVLKEFASKYEYFLVHDADDESPTHRFQTLIDNIGGYDAITSSFIRINPVNKSVLKLVKAAPSCFLYRTSVYNTIGHFADFYIGSDTQYINRMNNKGLNIKILDIILLHANMHDNVLIKKYNTETNNQIAVLLRDSIHNDYSKYNRTYTIKDRVVYWDNTIVKPEPVPVDITSLSIIISAYNTAEYIEDCLNSIYKQRILNDINFEVLVGIDACTNTLDTIKKIKDKYTNLRVLYMLSNKGTYITTNTLLLQAKYDNIIRFDSDDIFNEYALENIINEAKIYDVYRLTFKNFSATKQVDANLHLAHGVALFKKSAILKLGGFKPWLCAADTDILKRAERAGCNINTNSGSVHFNRRVHETSLTNNEATAFKSELRKKYVKEMNSDKTIYIAPIVNNFIEI